MIHSKKIVIIIGSIVCLLLAVLGSLAFGARYVDIHEVFNVFNNINDGSFNTIVVKERIPRTVFCILAGGSLGVSGSLMQAVTRNPIADPSILGVNTGASLFVVSGIAFFQISTASEYIWFALAGAAITAVFVYGICSLGSGGATPIKLALAGAATSAALSSLVSAIVLPRENVLNSFRFWQVGSVSGATWEGIATVLPFLIVGIVIGFIAAPALNAMALGDDMAVRLAVRTGVVRILAALAGVLLCGATTALAGPIGFVGLMVPHIVRLICGPDLRYVIPMSAVGGAILLTVADVIGRLIGYPGELEAGIVTAFIGAPILVFIAMREKVSSI